MYQWAGTYAENAASVRSVRDVTSTPGVTVATYVSTRRSSEKKRLLLYSPFAESDGTIRSSSAPGDPAARTAPRRTAAADRIDRLRDMDHVSPLEQDIRLDVASRRHLVVVERGRHGGLPPLHPEDPDPAFIG